MVEAAVPPWLREETILSQTFANLSAVEIISFNVQHCSQYQNASAAVPSIYIRPTEKEIHYGGTATHPTYTAGDACLLGILPPRSLSSASIGGVVVSISDVSLDGDDEILVFVGLLKGSESSLTTPCSAFGSAVSCARSGCTWAESHCLRPHAMGQLFCNRWCATGARHHVRGLCASRRPWNQLRGPTKWRPCAHLDLFRNEVGAWCHFLIRSTGDNVFG